MNRYIVERNTLDNNIQILLNDMSPCKVRGVVKGNGYGLDMLQFAGVLRNSGVSAFAITMPADAATLVSDGFGQDILMLRSTDDPVELDTLIQSGSIITIGSKRTYIAVVEACKRIGKPVRAHFCFDCGMCREGFNLDALEEVLPVLSDDGPISVTGVYTHFPRAGGPENDTRGRFERFMTIVEKIRDAGWNGEVHCANSITAMRFPEMRLDSVRIGSAFLGRVTYDGAPDIGLVPVGYLECSINEIRSVRKGESIGYGGIWSARRDSMIAILDAGYFEGINMEIGREMFSMADHVRAALSPIKRMIRHGGLHAIVNGNSVPVVGRVAMQQTMLDVTDVPCNVHDIAVIPCNPLLVRNVKREYR